MKENRGILKVSLLLVGLIAAVISLTGASGDTSGQSGGIEVTKVQSQGGAESVATAAVATAPGAACMDCHGSTPKYPLKGARQGYAASGHANNGNSRYANGDGCQKCHTNEGFIEFVAKGKVESKFVKEPSQQGCFTCHAPHETGTMELRTVKPVTLANGKTFDAGQGNLCASCHQSRGDMMASVKDTPANKVSPRGVAHHGAQADVLVGTNAYEYPDKKYASSKHGTRVEDSCVQCHYTQAEGRYGLSASVGGHSFKLTGEVHEAPAANLAACVTCHKDVKAVTAVLNVRGAAGIPFMEEPKKEAVFNIPARADYDQDGAKETVQEEVEGLLLRFVNRPGTGLLQQGQFPLYSKAGKTVAYPNETFIRTAAQLGALNNYLMFLEDRSKGVHNTKYTVEILYDSLQALDPSFDVSLRP